MKLFYDDEFDAINTAIGDCGKPFKTVASHMFPDMKQESAYARLKACCSPTGDQRLTFGQVVRLMAFCGRYDPLMYACDESTHARPARKSPQDDLIELTGVINSAASVMNQALARLEHIQMNNQSKVVMRAVA